ncbi:LemA family protein [Comamonas sp. J-3]|uniref:LemA family protein n=1 Tax=Comamonas trifloxystrobinivorans TaxID=3350256 RepID=UPI003726C77A
MEIQWIVVLVVLAVLLVWAIAVYNRLMELRNRTANALAQIDVQLKRRYDLIPNLVAVAKKYLEHESQTLEAVIRARSQAQAAATAMRSAPGKPEVAEAVVAAEGALGGALGRLMVLTESYPDLKADETMRSLSEELGSTENRIGYARQAYNDQVLEFNNATKAFPAIVVAAVLGFHAMPMLQSTQNAQEREVVRVQF